MICYNNIPNIRFQKTHGQYPIVFAILITAGIDLFILGCIIFSTPKEYTVKAKSIHWQYDIHIDELKQFHESGWSSPPEGAYNIESYRKYKGQKKVGDITIPDYDDWYEYNIDKWRETRVVTTQGYDKEPYWGEYTLRSTENERGIGNERAIRKITTYTVYGQLLNSDKTDLIPLEVDEYIWKNITINDELNYKKRPVGKPYAISLAE